MKKGYVVVMVVFFLSSLAQLYEANAVPLTNIGTARFAGEDYNLIFEGEISSGNKGLIWLDYTNHGGDWQTQNAWAESLNTTGTLIYSFNENLNISVNGAWRLPSAGDSPESGFNIVSSEYGSLYYNSLMNIAQEPVGIKKGPFVNLEETVFWTRTPNASSPDSSVWCFTMMPGDTGMYGYRAGFQGVGDSWYSDYTYAQASTLAVREATIFSQTPEPSTMVLLGFGLVSLAGITRKLT